MTSSGKEPPADERKREIEAQVAAKDKAEAKKPQRSELETGRRLAFVLELIARGEVKAKMPKGTPLSDGLEVPERDLAGREFATSQIASPCGTKVDENKEPQAKTEPGVGTGEGASAGRVMACQDPEGPRY